MENHEVPGAGRRVLRLKQVAELLNISESLAYQMAASGELPAFKVRSRWRFPVEEIERFIADGLARSA